jgi:AcrR family transcriptional regulator
MTDERTLLTPARIIRAAAELIETAGSDALSMRRVAAELGVAVMSLYNHVPNKAALLDGVAERIMAGLELADDPAADWQHRARTLVRAFRQVAHDHPRGVTLVLTRKIETPAGLRPAERALAIADAAGFDGTTSVRIMRALLAYAIGAQLREAGAVKMLAHPPRIDDLDPAEFPHVTALGAELVGHDPETDFEFGLDLLVSAIDALPRVRRDAPAGHAS